jgi:PAS domain S-box-containing protein
MEQCDRPAEGQSRILIVEDEVILSKDLERRLKAQGYEVVGKTDLGEEAVRIAEQTKPDLVLMDIKLSDEMDGIDAARLIRQRLDTAIVYLTGYSDRSDLFDRAKATDPYAYLSKPVSSLQLARTIEMALYKHQMERELRENRELLDLLINALPVAVVYVNADGVYEFTNEIHKRWWGGAGEQVRGRTVEEVLGHDQYGETVREHIKQALSDREVSYETTVAFKDGITRNVRVHYVPHAGSDGNIKGFVGLIADVTQARMVEEDLRVHQIELEAQNEDLRRAQAEMESLKDKYLDLYDFAPNGYVTIGEDGLVREANLTVCRLLGVERDSIISRRFSRYICEDNQDAYYFFWQKLHETRAKETCEVRLRSKDNGEFYSRLEGVCAYDAEGQVMGCRVSISDISDLKLARDARQEANEGLAKALREKDVLLREIHHRVKNNLAVMNSLLSLQAGFATDRVHRKMFTDAQTRIRSMALAHDLLYRSERLADIRSDEYIGNLLDYLIASISNVGKVVEIKKELEDLSFSLDTTIPVGFLITELVSNSLKHAFPDRNEGEIRVSLRSVGEQEFELMVKDDGVGIPEHVDLEDPQSLGLELVNTFVEQLKGQIEIVRHAGTEVRTRFKNR